MKIESIFGNMPVIETDRLILRKIEEKDIDDMFEYSSNPEVTKYLSYLHTDRQEAADYVLNKINQYKAGTCMIWGIEYKANKKYIGACGYMHWDTNHHLAELAYTLNQKYWGKGIASEIMKVLIDFGFSEMKLNRIEAQCWVDNKNSFKLMERFNMHYEGILRNRYFLKGSFQDMKLYSLLKKEYLEHQS
ncbi:GNAT family N-acetyltransferase [Plebeiibacterium sediminum]|uniref:GNAT family N-acetyltransferase n=1 Tax=Plebeiibacterium sediminum TaxID=2992112 RepID=A0AAE3SH98_9BACT|nr:GNAT family protein [Plebeiobacterium sediminum]MCW3789166.1 GNAT family N-acetyltransferase [Plebeiobacterium sediminum]